MGRVILVILAAAAVSPVVVRAAPGYDPWTWLLWGREVAGGTLSTADGPASEPLPASRAGWPTAWDGSWAAPGSRVPWRRRAWRWPAASRCRRRRAVRRP